MDYSEISSWIAVGCIAVFTSAAVVTDFRSRRIPNVLTISTFIAGIVFRGAADGIDGLQDAFGGFVIGFGTLFVLWVLGGGGAGDAKLMGALSVWLGAELTLSVLAASAGFVALITIAAPLIPRSINIVDPIPEGPVSNVPTENAGDSFGPQAESDPGTGKRRIALAFAIPVALATWLVLGLDSAGISFNLL